jgi:hypothetical protein
MIKYHFQYTYTTLFLISLIVGIFLFVSGILHQIADILAPLGYVGALLNGFFYTSAITATISSLLFVEFGNTLSPLPTAILGGLAAMTTDIILYRFFKDRLFGELHLLGNTLFSPKRLQRFILFLQKPWLRWFLPILGILVISSPFPDEIGIALFGLAGVHLRFLSLITFVANTIGIFILLTIGRLA